MLLNGCLNITREQNIVNDLTMNATSIVQYLLNITKVWNY